MESTINLKLYNFVSEVLKLIQKVISIVEKKMILTIYLKLLIKIMRT